MGERGENSAAAEGGGSVLRGLRLWTRRRGLSVGFGAQGRVLRRSRVRQEGGMSDRRGSTLYEIAILRGDLQRLKKAFREATELEKPAIRDNLRERIKVLHRAECHRRDRQQRTKTHSNICRNFWVTKEQGSRKQQNQVEEHLHQFHSDPRREDSLE
ncbi:hypothetical protein N1851_011270 [Merluccius polli]|uniref:Uncharacterized protein n=1 Tax=Merluccius polli TaxID=89951 RepID=A0AA47P5J9_MERPO|nr:hypothetical protein N1851_011270 [Merluccius polli]